MPPLPTPLTSLHMVEQLARAWSRMTKRTGGLVYADPESVTAVDANLYACPMPEARFRLDPCVSLVQIPAANPDDADPTANCLVRITIAARDPMHAHLLAGDFAKVFWPCGRPADLIEPGQIEPGLLGVHPSITLGGGTAWRFIDITSVARVEPVNGPGIGRRSEDGLVRLAFVVGLTAIEHDITPPAPTPQTPPLT